MTIRTLFISFFMIGLLQGCSKAKNKEDSNNQIGKTLDEIKKLSDDQYQLAKSYCELLKSKKDNNLVLEGRLYSFQTEDRGCDSDQAESFQTKSEVVAVGDNLEFQQIVSPTLANFFSSVIFHDNFSHKEFCEKIFASSAPIDNTIIAGLKATQLSFGNIYNNDFIQVEVTTGTKQSEGDASYKVTKIETLVLFRGDNFTLKQFSVQPPKGTIFSLNREELCREGEQQESQVYFQSIENIEN